MFRPLPTVAIYATVDSDAVRTNIVKWFTARYVNSFKTSIFNKSGERFNVLSENVNLGSDWPYYFIKGAENLATIRENFSFQIYMKSMKL